MRNFGRLSTIVTVGGFVGLNCIFNVDAGHRAIIFDQLKGVKKDVKEEGTHFFVPFLQRPVKFDVRLKPRVISTVTGTKGW